MARIILEGPEFDNYMKIKSLIEIDGTFICATGWHLDNVRVFGKAEAVELLFEQNRNLKRLLDSKQYGAK